MFVGVNLGVKRHLTCRGPGVVVWRLAAATGTGRDGLRLGRGAAAATRVHRLARRAATGGCWRRCRRGGRGTPAAGSAGRDRRCRAGGADRVGLGRFRHRVLFSSSWMPVLTTIESTPTSLHADSKTVNLDTYRNRCARRHDRLRASLLLPPRRMSGSVRCRWFRSPGSPVSIRRSPSRSIRVPTITGHALHCDPSGGEELTDLSGVLNDVQRHAADNHRE